MKKVFCIITVIFLVLGALLLEVGPLLPAIIVKNSTAVQAIFASVITVISITSLFYFVAVTVGAALAIFGDKVVKTVGYGLLFGSSFVAIAAFVTVVNSIDGNAADMIGPGPLVALIGVVFVAIAAVADLIGSRLSLQPEVSANVHDILVWKDLLDKGIITKDEFEAKKKEILHLDAGIAPSTIDLTK